MQAKTYSFACGGIVWNIAGSTAVLLIVIVSRYIYKYELLMNIQIKITLVLLKLNLGLQFLQKNVKS